MAIKIFFVRPDQSPLSKEKPDILYKLRTILLSKYDFIEVCKTKDADAILIQEKNNYVDWRYIKTLTKDPLIGRYLNKVFTINCSDCASGLLKGAYTCLDRHSFRRDIHTIIPYPESPNPLFKDIDMSNIPEPRLLATWKGNPKSCKSLRLKIYNLYHDHPDFHIERTTSWFNHQANEFEDYIKIISSGMFSLCQRDGRI